jgi:hypothetical protein
MKFITENRFIRKYGKKALIIYVCWCVLKGMFFLVAGYTLLG